jgi:hypothetical protein
MVKTDAPAPLILYRNPTSVTAPIKSLEYNALFSSRNFVMRFYCFMTGRKTFGGRQCDFPSALGGEWFEKDTVCNQNVTRRAPALRGVSSYNRIRVTFEIPFAFFHDFAFHSSKNKHSTKNFPRHSTSISQLS